MNILMMTNTYLPVVGGVEKSIQSFSGYFRACGHRVLVAVPGPAPEGEADENVAHLPAMYSVRRQGLTVNLPVPAVWHKLVDSFRPDVIHVHHPFLVGEMAARLALRSGRPLIYTHHVLLEQYAHYLPMSPDAARRFLVSFSAGFANLAARVIAPSPEVRDGLIAAGVRTPVTVLPTGVDASAFSAGDGRSLRAELGVPEDAFAAGYVGRLAKEKNLEFLTRAMARFLRKNAGAHFIIIGDGPCLPALREMFRGAGLEGRAHFRGAVRGADLVRHYHALDAFVFASKSETQGLVLYEAMASGVPVAALDAPGVREIVRDGVNGRLVAAEEEEAFEDAVSWLAGQRGTALERLKAAAVESVAPYSVEACARRALELYEAAIRQKDRAGDEETWWRRAGHRAAGEWRLWANLGQAAGRAFCRLS